jgi:hypothetical protein
MFFTPAEAVDSLNGAEVGNPEEAHVNVEEAVAAVAQMPAESVLVAKPPLTWGAEAMFVQLTDDFCLPQWVKDAGYEYLLGGDDINNLLEFLKKKSVSNRTVAEFIIHYAVTDSAPSWINDIPDIAK